MTFPLRSVLFFASLSLLVGCQTVKKDEAQGVEWPVYGGDPGGMKYSALTEINRGNVDLLELAWTWETGEGPMPLSGDAFVRPGPFEATPLMIDDTLYLSTSYGRAVALDANTGAELWSYDPRAWEWGQTFFHHRGVATWTDGKERRIFINSRWRLIALDAATGLPIPTFGQGGEIDLTKGLIWDVFSRLHYQQTSPPVVYKNLVIVGSAVTDRWVYPRNTPGDVQAFDVRTGDRVWSFHTIPQDGEFGNETWEDNSWSYKGSTNVWGPFTLDDERGLVYLPVSTPNGDFYGGDRKGDNLFAESIVCLDANTGKRVWHFQTVHHGLWDYDLAAPPNLVTIHVDGKTIDAVVVLGKTGFAYVFDRVTGEPVWPIEERPVPQSDVPGERTSPTQPFPTKPPPFARQGFTLDDVIDFTPALRAQALEIIKDYRIGPIFTPPSIEGTIVMGEGGGANWGGAAFDTESNVLFIRAENRARLMKLVERSPEAGYWRDGHGFAADPYPPPPEGEHPRYWIPIDKPPYTVLTAIDLNAGEHVWQVPLGDSPAIRNHPLLRHLDLPQLGITKRPPHGVYAGPLVTRGGLVFISGGGFKLYAIDKADGGTLWEGDLGGARGLSNPMTYQTRSGRQFVVIATSKNSGESGHEDYSESRLMAFSIPQP